MALNENQCYLVMGAYQSYGGYWGSGKTILEALENAQLQGGGEGDKFCLLLMTGDWEVNWDGSLSHEGGGLKYLTPKTAPRLFPKNLKKEARNLANLYTSSIAP
jgi:hypothetical protein